MKKTILTILITFFVVSAGWHYYAKQVKYCYFAKGFKDVAERSVIYSSPYGEQQIKHFLPAFMTTFGKGDYYACALIGEEL